MRTFWADIGIVVSVFDPPFEKLYQKGIDGTNGIILYIVYYEAKNIRIQTKARVNSKDVSI